MSHRVNPTNLPVTFELDGESIVGQAQDTVAAAFIAAGRTTLSRSIKYHRPRGPFCFSGGCSQCLVRIDGSPNQYACQTEVRQGMRVERQNAFPDATVDVLQATDFVFSKWFNHHEFMAGVPVVEKVMLQVARKLAGLGRLPEKPAPLRAAPIVESVAVALVGGGAAGLSASRRLHDRKVPFSLFERERACGGRLLIGCDEGAPAIVVPPDPSIRTASTVIGVFADDGKPFLVALENERLRFVFYERLLLTNGGQPTLLAFPNNDLPGVYSGRAVSRMIRAYGVVPGERIAVVGEPDEARSLAKLIVAHGSKAVAVGSAPERAHGLRSVTAMTVTVGETTEKHECDAVAVCAPVSPAFELARAAGARVSWDSRSRFFTVEADTAGKAAEGVWVAGELRGPMSAAAASEQGLVAGEAIAAAVKGGVP
jgi:sarcosine oxidase, subunit alpha